MQRPRYVYIRGREVPESVVVLLIGSLMALLTLLAIQLFN